MPRQRNAVVVELDAPDAPIHPTHRRDHLDQAQLLTCISHMGMANNWPVTCPIFMEQLRRVGLYHVAKINWMTIDRYLITSLVERWSPDTNTFHLPMGEMTVTLQDVAIILGLRVNGLALIADNPVGKNCRWATYSLMCQELLGECPKGPGIPVHSPFDKKDSAIFTMGQAKSRTCVPLRWLLWTFSREHYDGLNSTELLRCVRAYVLFMIGTCLMPDTSGNEVHLRWLVLVEDLDLFSGFSLGSAVLAHLYRELYQSVVPERNRIGGCLQLLQIWAWERLFIGLPKGCIDQMSIADGCPLGSRWNESRIKPATLLTYRNDINKLPNNEVKWMPYSQALLEKLPSLCRDGSDIWRARVPLISWIRVEWHFANRVLRQFGLPPLTNLPRVEDQKRKDARGKASINWVVEHQPSIEKWDLRGELLAQPGSDSISEDEAIKAYMDWYASWAKWHLGEVHRVPPIMHTHGSVLPPIAQFWQVVRDTLEPLRCKDILSELVVARDYLLRESERFGRQMKLIPDIKSSNATASTSQAHLVDMQAERQDFCSVASPRRRVIGKHPIKRARQ